MKKLFIVRVFFLMILFLSSAHWSTSSVNKELLREKMGKVRVMKIEYLKKEALFRWSDDRGRLYITDASPEQFLSLNKEHLYAAKDTPQIEKVDPPVRASSENPFKESERTSMAEPEEEEILLAVPEEEITQVPDPLESFNRVVFSFNDYLYFYAIKPLTKGYSSLIPQDFRIVIKNFFRNITVPIRFLNCLLQGMVEDAGREVTRFFINSTVGVAGLADVASDWGIKEKREDFGQTLAVYKVGSGPYIVLPLLGPSTLRDTIGSIVDAFADPINYLSRWENVMAVQSGRYINNMSFHLGEYEDLKASAIDPYVSMKDAYIQHREKEVKE